MGDTYREIMVKPKMSFGKRVLKAGFPIMAGICFLLGMAVWPFLIGTILFLVLSFFVGTKLDVEYEYLYVNGELDIDAIYSRQKRKRIASFDIEKLELLAPQNSHALDSYLNNGNVKVLDYSSKEAPQQTYVLVLNEEKGRKIIKVELDEVILKDMRRLAPRKVVLM